MKTTNETERLVIMPVESMNELEQSILNDAVQTYKDAFGPTSAYNEKYSDEEAADALEYSLTKGGDLLLGMVGGKVISFASGYMRPNGTYYVEELGVSPNRQGEGIGRATFEALMMRSASRSPASWEIRTTARNRKAIALYESDGFVREFGTEVAAQTRQDGKIALDERVYLAKPPLDSAERLRCLKRVCVAYPSGNTTAVVFDQLLTSDRKTLNRQLMEQWQVDQSDMPEIEQCCFVTMPRNPKAVARVEMFGGEFCGNATRSVAWLVTKGRDYTGNIEVSGVERPLAFMVKDGEVAVEMPLPDMRTNLTRIVEEGTLVQLDGIAQLVVTDRFKDLSPRELLQGILKDNRYNLAEQPAVGVSYYDMATGKAQFCVWVRDVDTIFDETACGSGTCAIGVALATNRKKSVSVDVVQPSGESIRTEAVVRQGEIAQSWIAGKVGILYDGEVALT